jgi:hypothetical protein
MAVEVRFVADARAEFRAIRDQAERKAMLNAIDKLEQLGDRLPFPHASSVQGARDVWELRPRRGRSPHRALYRRIGDAIVIGAFGPEAQVDQRGFDRAVRNAQARLDAEQAAAARKE